MEKMNIAFNIYKKTLAYELERIQINDDGTTTHFHSDAFLDEHPERKDSPEYTEKEELQVYKFIAEMAKRF